MKIFDSNKYEENDLVMKNLASYIYIYIIFLLEKQPCNNRSHLLFRVKELRLIKNLLY